MRPYRDRRSQRYSAAVATDCPGQRPAIAFRGHIEHAHSFRATRSEPDATDTPIRLRDRIANLVADRAPDMDDFRHRGRDAVGAAPLSQDCERARLDALAGRKSVS